MAVDKEVEFSKGKQQGFKGKLNAAGQFLWNGATNEFLGRTAKSWALIGIYYLIFYSCLAGFFAVNLLVFFTTISDTEPKLQNKDTLLKGHPGLGFRPMVNSDNTLIAFEQGKTDERYKAIMQKFEEFLAPYNAENQTDDKIYQDCEAGTKPEDGKVCRFQLSQLGNCTKENNGYGYFNGKPCVLIKLNKIFGWKPESIPVENKTCDSDCPPVVEENYVGVTCEGESAADRENMGKIAYYPKGGFAFSYYPYTKQKGYLAPLVAVQFEDPKPGVLLMIWCKAWAKDIKHHKNDRAGSVHFELFID